MSRSITVLLFVAFTLSLSSATLVDTTVISRADSLPLSVIIADPGYNPRGVVQIVHGMCEHKERYIPFIYYLVDNGYAVVIHDHRGHGASVRDTSELGYFGNAGYSAMIDDAIQVGDLARQRYPRAKFLLFGHSMGSMVVRSYVKRNDTHVDALVVCGSPSYNASSAFGATLAKNAAKKHGDKYRPKQIQRLSFGSFNRRFRNEGSPNAWICSDTAVVRAYDADPLCNFQFTANGFYNLFSLMQYTYGTDGWAMQKPYLPILFISGADDPCLVNKKRYEAAQNTMRRVGYSRVDAILYPDMRHEILNEKEKHTVWTDILNFFDTITLM